MAREQTSVGHMEAVSSPVTTVQDDTFYFSSPERNQLLDLLRHLTVNSEQIALVQGQAGVGKTTLLDRFQSEAPDNWRLCQIDANLMLQPEQLFSLLAKDFGLEVDDERVIERLVGQFQDLNREGWLPVILVDDAHLLPVATIISLLRLYERHPDNRALIRIVLLAEPAIEQVLQTPQIRAMNLQLLQRLEIPPLNQEQTEQMIHQMLLRRKLTDQLDLTRGQLEKVYRDSGGLPGEITYQLERLLGGQPAEQPSSATRRQRSLPAGLSVRRLVGLMLLAVLFICILWFQDEINAIFQGEKTVEELVSLPPVSSETLVPLELPEPVQPVPDEDVFRPRPEPQQSGKAADAPRLALPEIRSKQGPNSGEGLIGLPVTAPPPDQAPQTQVVTEEQESPTAFTDTSERPPYAPMEQDRWSLAVPLDSNFSDGLMITQSPDSSVRIATDGDRDMVEKPEASPREPVSETPKDPSPLPAGEERNIEPADSVPAVAAVAKPSVATTEAVEQTSKVSTEGEPSSAVNADIGREAWLLAQNPSAYTLQLIGVREENAAAGFIRSHGLQGPVAYFRSLREGRAWFSVVYGVFPDREAAVAGRTKLPSALREAGVWPRSLASVQQAIRQK